MTFPVRVPVRPDVRRWAGAVALAAACGLSLAACGGGYDQAPVSDGSDEPTRAAEPKDAKPTQADQSPSESPTPSPTADDGTAVPVYFAGDGPQGTALFREFHRVSGDPLLEAARLVAGGSSDDPDYRTLWPQVEIASVTATDGVLLVEVPGDGFTEAPDGMTKRDARLAVQQLVYTLQGVQQERIPVQIKRGGSDFRLFGLPTDVPYEAASALETLNLVSITSPAEGDTVTGDTLTVTGVANSFEASGPCRLVVGGQEVVEQAYQSEAWMEDRLFPFEVDIPLQGVSGEVVVQCETDDPSGGAEGNGPAVDTRTITVQ